MTEKPFLDSSKLAFWRMSPESQESASGDPTRLELDLDHEEVYESRVYPIRQQPQTLALFGQLLSRMDTEIPEGEILQTAESVIDKTSFKVLAKRNKDSRKISYLVSLVMIHARVLVDRAELVDEETYRQYIESLEAGILCTGIAGTPLIVTTDEWHRDMAEAISNAQN